MPTLSERQDLVRGAAFVNSRYLTIAGRIRQDVQDIQGVVERVLNIWREGTDTATTHTYYVDATALNLHGFYAGVERLLEVIADGIEQTKPSGSDWHQALLQQLTSDIPGVRPAVLQPQTREQLNRYRGFRHVVRNVYTFNLDPEQVGLLVKHLQPTMTLVSHDLLSFADFLERLASNSD